MGNYLKEDRLEFHETPEELVNEMFEVLKRYYKDEITEYLEPAAGKGRIIESFDKPYIAYDIEPHTERSDITIKDYLKTKIPYKKGRVCIQNPPFNKGLKFVYKSLEECDYTVALLSQNSIVNLDYSKYWVDEIQLWRNYPFEKTKVSITIMGIRKRRNGDKYEYEPEPTKIEEPQNKWW
jgi:hypothetical protein